LRFRLSSWNTGVILALLALTLFGVHAGLRYTLMAEMDKQLDEDAREVGLILDRFRHDPDKLLEAIDRKANSHDEHGWFVQVYDQTGLRWSSNGAPAGLAVPVVVSGRPETVDRLRWLNVRYFESGDAPLLVRIGTSLDSFNEDMARLTRWLLTVGLLLFVVIPLSGYWLAGRATRPLAEMVQTAARLRPTHLAERLPTRGTGDELDDLALIINGFLDRMAEYLDRKRDFLANAAHELRSPLTAIRASVEVALEQDRRPEEYRDLLGSLAEQCDGLTTLVNQLLLLAEGDAGRLRPGGKLVRLDAVVGKSVEMFRGVAEYRGITLEGRAGQEMMVAGDGGHLRQVVNNLIDNALKYTPSGGRVTVNCQFDASAGRACLEVRDTGTGIAADDLPHVFDRFYRADKSRSRSPGPGGNGLGLSICQAIVSSYGGQLRIASSTGAGTCVTVMLPATLPETATV
jgi:heavy metal sensor kinase